MKSKPFLIGGFRVLLLTVGSDQRSIDVDDQRILSIGVVVRGVFASQFPHPGPGCCPGLVDRCQGPVDVAGKGLDDPGDRRIRCHRPVKVGFVAECCGIGQGVTTKSESDREIEKDLGWIMNGEGLLPRCQRRFQMVVESAGVHGFGEQEPAGVAEGVAGCAIDVQAGIGAGRLHSESAPFPENIDVVANIIIPGQEHFLLVSPASGRA